MDLNIIRLKEIREDNDLKQEDVARALGIKQQQYSEYERGVVLISIEKLDKLADFYKAYSDWIDDGAPEGKPFSRNCGICVSLTLHLKDIGLTPKEREQARKLMRSQFIKAGLNGDYQFNNRELPYLTESAKGMIHTNKNRIAWVKREWQHYV